MKRRSHSRKRHNPTGSTIALAAVAIVAVAIGGYMLFGKSSATISSPGTRQPASGPSMTIAANQLNRLGYTVSVGTPTETQIEAAIGRHAQENNLHNITGGQIIAAIDADYGRRFGNN